MSIRCDWTADRSGEICRSASRARKYFPHGVVRLSRGGPDGLKIARNLLGCVSSHQLRQIVLYASPEAVRDLPRELFFDRDVQWHEQHCGLPCQVAWANLVLEGDELVVTAVQSDLVQRIKRRPEHRTRVDNDFGDWAQLLWNAVADYAADLGLQGFRAPTSRLVLEQVVPADRKVGPSLFVRTYDDALLERFVAAETDGWRRVDLADNRDRIVSSSKKSGSFADDGIVSIFHDVERGLGHQTANPGFVNQADRVGRKALSTMLAVERKLGIRATYNVVGQILPEVEDEIRADGHAVAFHSFDHGVPSEEQLWRCRAVDYRLKGYRAPQSKRGDITDQMLSYYNFEWFASSAYSLGFAAPRLCGSVATLPVHADDYWLYTGQSEFDEWEAALLKPARNRSYTAIGLHDCYAEFWLDNYESLLGKLGEVGAFRTLDEIAGQTFLEQAQ